MLCNTRNTNVSITLYFYKYLDIILLFLTKGNNYLKKSFKIYKRRKRCLYGMTTFIYFVCFKQILISTQDIEISIGIDSWYNVKLRTGRLGAH